MDCSLPGSSAHGIFQARVLEWGAIAFSGLMAQLCPTLATPGTVTCQAPLPMGDIPPGKNTGMGCHFLLEGIFLTLELTPGRLFTD